MQEILFKIEDGIAIIGTPEIENETVSEFGLIDDFMMCINREFLISKTIIDLRGAKRLYNDLAGLIDTTRYHWDLSILADAENPDLINDLSRFGCEIVPAVRSLRVNPKPLKLDEDIIRSQFSSPSNNIVFQDYIKDKQAEFKDYIEREYLHDSISSFLNIAKFQDKFKVFPSHGCALYNISFGGDASPFRLMRYSASKAPLDAIKKFEAILNTKTIRESDIQEYLEENPSLFAGLFADGAKIYPHMALHRINQGKLIPDFFAQPFSEKYLEVVDLKLPSKSIYLDTKNRNRFSQAVIEGIAQLREYSAYFDDEINRENFKRSIISRNTQEDVECYKPLCTLVIGADDSWKTNQALRRDMLTSYGDIHIVTYDELIKKCKSRLLI